MADSFIGITEPALPNKKLDSESLTVGANTVERERIQIAGDSDTDIAPVTATDGLSVKVTNTVPVSGPLTDAQLRATPVPVSGTVAVGGGAAHDAPVSGNPALIAGISQDMDDTAPPNTVSAEGDTVRVATDRDGAVFVRPFGPRLWNYHENSSSALTDTSVHAAPDSGFSLFVTDIIVSIGANTAFNIFFEEGSTTVLGPYYLEAVNGRGLAIHFQTPKKITAASALTVTTSAAIAHSIDVHGFISR